MGLSCGAKVLKYCLFAFNLIFVIGGLVCMGVGIWLAADKNAVGFMEKTLKQSGVKQDEAALKELKDTPNLAKNLGIILAVGGGIILVIAFMGCCGAVKEWRPMLICYAIFLGIILAVEIGIAIYAAVKKDDFIKMMQDEGFEWIKQYNGTEQNPNWAKSSWDVSMNFSKCCGVHKRYADRGFGESDWSKTVKRICPETAAIAATVGLYPISCCKPGSAVAFCNGQYGYCTAGSGSIYDESCADATEAEFKTKIGMVIGVGIGVGIVQLIGILFAFCLCCAIGGQQHPQ